MTCVEEEYQSVDLFSAEEALSEWDGPPAASGLPPTVDSTLPSPQIVLPAIHAAVYDPNLSVEAIEELVVADPLCLGSVEPQYGYTPLHCAAKRCNMPLIKMLVHHGAIVDARASRGETPLMIACESGSLYVVHVLSECGADLSLRDSNEQSSLHYAAKSGAVHILHYLSLKGGLNFRTTDNQGNSPLHCAAYNLKLDTVAYLLRHKRSDVRAANNEGLTAVHYAAKHGSIEMCWLLLRRTLNSRKKDPLSQREKNGLTPLDIAMRGQHERHKLLTKRLQTWSVNPDYMRLFPWGWWVFFSLLGGLTLLLSLLAFTQLYQPVGFVVAVGIALPGFFLPLSLHRIPHPSGWPNPIMVGGLVAGVGLTTLIYFLKIFSVLWPDYAISFLLLALNAFIALVLFFKLKTSDPGFDKVGKLGKNGKPLTIQDVAKQASDSPHGFAFLEGKDDRDGSLLFCTSCEIVISEYTKHCKLCEGCCRGFDHHCMWLTRCVGYNNHRMFLVFMICLALDNCFFVYHALIMMGRIGKSDGLWGAISVGFTDETAVMMLLLCNLVAAGFAVMNLGQQFLQISRMETTYFDAEGRGAYRKKRHGPSYSLLTRLKLIYLFFTNYSSWHSRRPHTPPTLTV